MFQVCFRHHFLSTLSYILYILYILYCKEYVYPMSTGGHSLAQLAKLNATQLMCRVGLDLSTLLHWLWTHVSAETLWSWWLIELNTHWLTTLLCLSTHSYILAHSSTRLPRNLIYLAGGKMLCKLKCLPFLFLLQYHFCHLFLQVRKLALLGFSDIW